jgi:peptidoglycan-associated lipoprotein
MAKLRTALIIATMAVAVAGCQKKRPETLPPGPGPVDPGPGPGPDTSGEDAPGTPGHFKRNVISDTVLFALDQYDIDAEARRILDSQS